MVMARLSLICRRVGGSVRPMERGIDNGKDGHGRRRGRWESSILRDLLGNHDAIATTQCWNGHPLVSEVELSRKLHVDAY